MNRFPEVLADRYRRFKFHNFEANAEHYASLASQGQHPKVMMVSCCDSRVNPETIFSAMPGELFIVRNVANLVPPYETKGRFHGVSSAVEYAVLGLQVEHVIVMGHSGCGGVNAALNKPAAMSTESQFVTRWMSMLDDARNEVLSGYSGASEDEKLRHLEQAGIKTSIANLRTFPFVSENEGGGRLALHGLHFDIKSGVMSVLNQTDGTFQPL